MANASFLPSSQHAVEHKFTETECESDRADVERADFERADFEIDEILRGLALDRWFATAQRDVPIWAF